MASIKKCPHCGHRIRNKLHAYSSGSGCLTLTWREDTREAPTLNRKVTKADAERYLKFKDNEHLVRRNWLPVFINDKWVLARHVKRTGPYRLRISGHSYSYSGVSNRQLKRVQDMMLTVTFKLRGVEHVMLNESVRMVIRYFLEHEQELKPQFKNHKVILGEV